nr:MAG: nonstructural protein [Microvirus sp.]
MKLKVFSIYDAKMGTYQQPFCAQTIGQATRLFDDLVNDQNTGPNKHPEDYTLFEIGSFEDEKGYFESMNTPHSLCLALELHRASKTQ